MTASMCKQIAMGVFDQNDVRQNFFNVAGDWGDTKTKWVRFWIPWYKLAPYGWNNPATDTSPLPGYNPGGFTVKQWVDAMDLQIKFAKQTLGLGVVLTFDWFPQWANGSTDRRIPPSNVSPDNAWAQYLAWIYNRWSSLNPNSNGCYADVIEICNEPNGYHDYPGAPADYFVAGRMMVTAQAIQQYYNRFTPILAGPALNDASFDTFSDNLMGYLATNGFTGFTSSNTRWAWTHHCYGDIEVNQGTMNRARRQRDRLASHGWRGWPNGDASNPYLLLTEGGARVPNVASATDRAKYTADGYTNVHNDNASGGKGIFMFTQYLDVSDVQPSGDCGLRDYSSPYAKRPVYDSWTGLMAP
jgi:hypothetical protein